MKNVTITARLEKYKGYRTPKVSGFDMYKVLGSIWFPVCNYPRFYNNTYGDFTVGTIGIVKVIDCVVNEEKYYIGLGKGENMIEDEDIILACGSRYEEPSGFMNINILKKMRETAPKKG